MSTLLAAAGPAPALPNATVAHLSVSRAVAHVRSSLEPPGGDVGDAGVAVTVGTGIADAGGDTRSSSVLTSPFSEFTSTSSTRRLALLLGAVDGRCIAGVFSSVTSITLLAEDGAGDDGLGADEGRCNGGLGGGRCAGASGIATAEAGSGGG